MLLCFEVQKRAHVLGINVCGGFGHMAESDHQLAGVGGICSLRIPEKENHMKAI